MFKTWTWEVGDGELKLSETEAMAHNTASIVMAKVNKALARCPNECILSRTLCKFRLGVLVLLKKQVTDVPGDLHRFPPFLTL